MDASLHVEAPPRLGPRGSFNGDKLVIECEGARFALDAAAVAGIVEVEKITYLPGGAGFVSGIISLRNEPVTVVDIRGVFQGLPAQAPGLPRRIIVLKEKTRVLGLDVGSAKISFLWKDGIDGKAVEGFTGRYTEGKIEAEDGQGPPVYVINWPALFDEAVRILSPERTAGA
ncbi:MAG: chemotaxis protein CheW [Deltaproteobacteria bacterium]